MKRSSLLSRKNNPDHCRGVRCVFDPPDFLPDKQGWARKPTEIIRDGPFK